MWNKDQFIKTGKNYISFVFLSFMVFFNVRVFCELMKFELTFWLFLFANFHFLFIVFLLYAVWKSFNDLFNGTNIDK